jgi:hypothetical protein
MMAVPKLTKKMLLFVSPSNALWSVVLKDSSLSQNKISDYMDLSHATIPGWKNSGNVKLAVARDAFSKIRAKINHHSDQKKKHDFPILTQEEKVSALEKLARFEKDFLDDYVSVYDTAINLGMSIPQCQVIIDEVIYKRSPIFPTMYFDSRAEADAAFEVHRGAYLLWVKRRIDSRPVQDMWFQATLRVRYVLEVGGGFVIRCKLNAPIFAPLPGHRPYWEYDGFLVHRPNKVFWMFEKRVKEQNDHFYFITGAARAFPMVLCREDKRQRTMAGVYLTTGQDEFQSIVSDRLILQRRLGGPSQSDDEEKIRKFMHELPDLIRDKRRTELESVLKDFEPSLSDDAIKVTRP